MAVTGPVDGMIMKADLAEKSAAAGVLAGVDRVLTYRRADEAATSLREG